MEPLFDHARERLIAFFQQEGSYQIYDGAPVQQDSVIQVTDVAIFIINSDDNCEFERIPGMRLPAFRKLVARFNGFVMCCCIWLKCLRI